MNPRPFLLLLGATLACGGPPSSEARLGLDVLLDRAVADELGAFQVVVLPAGRTRNCIELQRTCLSQQVEPQEPLMLRGPDGEEARVLRFPAKLEGGVQELAVDVPVGRDYAVVIEALSGGSPPRFLGSSCNYLSAVNASGNEPLVAAAITLTGGECDPSFSP
ncbi:MAG TPA: hypothetical protein VLQ93_05075 [Myxococcaceae bacterium]|nr:hypothetical protein [Myxococcaceae bacterium]